MKRESSLVRKFYQERTIRKFVRKAKLLGPYVECDIEKFLAERMLVSIVMFILVLICSSNGYILAPLMSIMFYYGIDYFYFDYRIKKRARKLDNEGLFFFEVLAVTLESGKNLKGALDITCENVDSELSEEFKKALREVRLGKSMNEALSDMKERIPSETINNVLLNITQSTIFGNSIIESIYNQVDYLREKQLLEVKSEINKMPIKMSVISVIFFIPLMMILVLGPVIVNMIAG